MTDNTTAQASAAAGGLETATAGEKTLAILAIAFALLVGLMGADMLTGGKISGYVRPQVTGDDGG